MASRAAGSSMSRVMRASSRAVSQRSVASGSSFTDRERAVTAIGRSMPASVAVVDAGERLERNAKGRQLLRARLEGCGIFRLHGRRRRRGQELGLAPGRGLRTMAVAVAVALTVSGARFPAVLRRAFLPGSFSLPPPGETRVSSGTGGAWVDCSGRGSGIGTLFARVMPGVVDSRRQSSSTGGRVSQ